MNIISDAIIIVPDFFLNFRLGKLIHKAPIMVFMKGNPQVAFKKAESFLSSYLASLRFRSSGTLLSISSLDAVIP